MGSGYEEGWGRSSAVSLFCSLLLSVSATPRWILLQKKFTYFNIMCISVLPVCLSVYHMRTMPNRGQMVAHPPELELQRVVSNPVGAGN